MQNHRFFVVALRCCLLFGSLLWVSAEAAQAEVVRWQVKSREILANGRLFGKAGAYEKVSGRLHYAVDPEHPSNQSIVDLDAAPRGSDGRVHFTGDAIFMQPLDPQRRKGTLVLDVPNRGQGTVYTWFHGLEADNKEPWLAQPLLLEQGFGLLWVGWQMDTPYDPELLSLDRVEAAVEEVGVLRSDAVFGDPTAVMPLAHRNHRPYGVSDPADPRNQLTVRDHPNGTRRLVERSAWRFGRLDKAGKVVPDPFWVHLDGGFEAGKIYEVVYVANNPTVNGLGLAAIRDAASYFKYEAGRSGIAPSASKPPRRVLAWGVSQAGRLLRQMLYEGLAVDGQGRQVFDGVWIHGAGAGRGSFNHRFAEPSRDGHAFASFFYPVDLPPFTGQQGLYDSWRQAAEGNKTEGNKAASPGGVLPAKVLLTHTSYEYWSRGASLTHTTPDGKGDAVLDANERIYFLAGTQHGLDPWPTTATATRYPANGHDYRYALRALLVSFDGWLHGGPALPPSRYPKIDDGTLVETKALHFPTLPEVEVPGSPYRPMRLDFGQRFGSHGIIDHQPPRVGEPWPVFVPQVGADGNELAGIRLPHIGVPVAVHTGWNLRRPQDGGAEHLALFRGAMFPLPVPESGVLALEERYGGPEEYLRRVKHLARKMVQEGFLLDQDLSAFQQQSVRAWRFALPSHDEEGREPLQFFH